MNETTQIHANGGSADDWEGGEVQDLSGGGGSGGSIYIGTESIKGGGSNVLSVAGGGGWPFGSAGSGGRAVVKFFSWYDKTTYDKHFYAWRTEADTAVNISSGLTGFSGQTGTMFNTPCAPGHEPPFCQQCAKGFYKPDMSGIRCYQCTNAVVTTAIYNETGVTQPNCPYKCSPNYPSREDNPLCYNPFILFVSNLGGVPVFIIIIASALIWIVLAYIYVKGEDSKEGKMTTQELNDMIFFQKDVHQHIGRIYLQGFNSQKNPWKMPSIPHFKVVPFINRQEYLELIQKVNENNQRTKESLCQSWFYKVVYPPSIVLLS